CGVGEGLAAFFSSLVLIVVGCRFPICRLGGLASTKQRRRTMTVRVTTVIVARRDFYDIWECRCHPEGRSPYKRTRRDGYQPTTFFRTSGRSIPMYLSTFEQW